MPFIGTISRPERFVRYCAKPASAGPSFSIFSEQLPRRLLGGAGAVGRTSSTEFKHHPLPTLPIKEEGSKSNDS